MPTPFDGMAPGTWRELPGTKLRAVMGNAPWNPLHFLGAWNGAAWDTKRSRFVFFGGGHGDYPGNEVAWLDPLTGAMGCTARTAGWSTTDALDVYPDGRPVARHTYGGIEYLPDQDVVMVVGGSRWHDGLLTPLTWWWSPVDGSWTQKATLPAWGSTVRPPGNIEGCLAWDATQRRAYFQTENSILWAYDPALDAWQPRGAATNSGAGKTAVLAGNLFFRVGRGVYTAQVDTSPPFHETLRVTSGDVPAWLGEPWRYPGVAYDPDAGLLVAWVGGGEVWTLHPTTLVWTRYTPVTFTIPPAAANVLTKWRYHPTAKVFVTCFSIDENAWAWKPAYAAAPPPTPMPAPAPPPPALPFTLILPQDTPAGAYTLVPAGVTPPPPAPAPVPVPVPPPPAPTPVPVPLPAPAGAWTASPLPLGVTGKHISGAYCPLDGRLYYTAGDHGSGFGQPWASGSYRQDTFSLDLRDRTWRLDYPYTGPAGAWQPTRPDWMGWAWDSRRSVFWQMPGWSPSEFAIAMFGPVTKRWFRHDDYAQITKAGDDPWGLVYDAEPDELVQFRPDGARHYAIDARTWREVPFGQTANAHHGMLAHDPMGRVVYGVNFDTGHLWRYDLLRGRVADVGLVPAGPMDYEIHGFRQAILLWAGDRLVFHRYPGSWHAYTPGAGWTDLPSATADGRLACGLIAAYDPVRRELAVYGFARVGIRTPGFKSPEAEALNDYESGSLAEREFQARDTLFVLALG